MSIVKQISLGVPAERRSYPFLVAALGVVFLLATVWFVNALASEPSTAQWGFLVANFIFLLGITQFGIAFSAIMRICKADWARSYYRIAELITLSFLPFAIIGFLYIHKYGSPHLFYWFNEPPEANLSPWLDSTFLLYRNLLAQLVFYVMAIVYFVMGLLPDITEQDSRSGPTWRQSFYRWLLSIKRNKDNESLKHNVYFYAPLVLVVTVIANTFIAWDFGMMLVPHYHSTIYPMYFILGNMLAGTAALFFLMVVLSQFISIDNYFKTVQIQSIGILLTVFALFWLYMFWSQFFVSWFGNLPHEYGVLSLQMYGHYAPFFWIMMCCNFGIPFASLIFLWVKQTLWTMTLLAVIINIGMWLNRYLLVIPALVEGHHPFMTFSELTMTISLVTGFLFVLLFSFNVFPMVSMWELRAIEND